MNRRLRRGVTLKAGSQDREFNLINLNFGTLEGTAISDGKPIAGVTVKLLAEYGGIVGKTVTDAQGRYRLRAIARKYTVVGERTEAPLYTSNNLQVTLGEGKTETLDLPLSNQGFGRIKLDVKVRLVDGSLKPVAITDWRTALDYRLEVSAVNAAQGYRSGTVDERGIAVYGTPGDVYRVCATGIWAGFSSACAQVTLNDAREAAASLEMKEAARLTGIVANYTLNTQGTFQWREKEDDYWIPGQSLSFSDKGEYSLSMPKPGQYRLYFYDNKGGLSYQSNGEIAQDQWARLPPATMTSYLPRFAEKRGNGYAQSDLRATAGGTVTLQAAYRLDGAAAVDDAVLIISVPAGATLLPDSVMLNRMPVAVTDEGSGAFAIKLGRLASGAQGSLSYRVALDEIVPFEMLHQIFMRYNKPQDGGTNRETIGSAYIRTAEVTLEAPETSSQLSFTVNGRAPAGKQVLVYADRALVGTAQSTAGGAMARQNRPAGQGVRSGLAEASRISSDRQGRGGERICGIPSFARRIRPRCACRCRSDDVPGRRTQGRIQSGRRRRPFSVRYRSRSVDVLQRTHFECRANQQADRLDRQTNG
ncbi:carboxypeptidase-like regulatory domain-containing protein [Cohnella rhizosphaerae]|uniref:Carboxypeptidase-like regulatory domain-containing protein n=1 Tax=Cohnella rhizosphaerae TaxID=1457232 RepID=A0A9X4QRX2_9BACL|nr:carboxypeptidase-like regulatory domain-containing protein [Cohnella rhizosphaerae]MDG0809020.1 carboxypeptidase-like regulatory domain-containing protein [Cohnella rhizosphaerae]